jgi:hypothetical protein
MPVDPARHGRLTYDDFVQFPDDGLRHEIIDGEHHVAPSPNLRHQDLVGRLHLSLGAFLEDRPERGRVFLSPFEVVFSFHDVVEPDLVDCGTRSARHSHRHEHSRRARTRRRDRVAVDAYARRAGEAPPVRAHRCARVLARKSRSRHGHRLPARRRWLIPASGRSHCAGTRHADVPAPAGMVAGARAVVPLKACSMPWSLDRSSAHS